MARETGQRPALLCISPSYAPDTAPTAIRASKLLERLSANWDVTVLTESRGSRPDTGVRVEAVRGSRPDTGVRVEAVRGWRPDTGVRVEAVRGSRPDTGVRVEAVRGWRPSRALAALRRARMSKLLEMLIWPDESIFWTAPAILAARRLIRELKPRAIVVFMMPYSAGLAGIVLSRLSGLPLILNLDDSPTCTDMHPHFPTRLHYRLARALEDFYARQADAVVYVSQTNLDAVRSRQPADTGEKLQLVRYGADSEDFRARRSPSEDFRARRLPSEDFRARRLPSEDFEIVYVGAMSGWWSLIDERAPSGRMGRVYDAWMRLGRYQQTRLDQRTSSPAIIGGAILDAIGAHPGWAGRVKLTIHGNPYPASVVAQALASAGVESVVTVLGPVPHEQVADIVSRADLLFMTLPKRLDGSAGGRISAKTYEYLATDRPILAALPAGENWSYLADKPGVWLVSPDDRNAMKQVIIELAAAKLDGSPRTFARESLQRQISYESRASEFAAVLSAGIARRRR
jgi:glycosyltransferase involved in cell wall biosynthesis